MKGQLKLWLAAASAALVFADVDEFCGYAPLCGTANQEFDWQTGLIPEGVEGTVLLAAEINFEDCCKLADTKPTETCQIVDPKGESYRTITASEPICGSGGAACSGECSQYQLVINPTFVTSSQNDKCCDSCTCFGDPQCISFDGTEKIWVLCDGRDIPHEDSIFDMCRITKSQCEKEKDHTGKQCKFLAEDGRARDWTTGKQGSPCVPDPTSPPSEIVMYEVADAHFKMTLTQGERGIIQKARIDLDCGSFELDAARCMERGKNAWRILTDSPNNLPEFFSYNDVITGFDEHWSIVDPFSGISISIRCHANHYVDDENSYVPRMNIEDLSDPVPRGNGNSGGFCTTGKFNTGLATTANTNKIFSKDLCTEGLQDSELRDIYRAMCKNPGLPASAHESCVNHFCLERYQPLYSSVQECLDEFSTSLASGFCKGVTYTTADAEKCFEQWFDLGAVETIIQYYDDESGCTSETQTTLNKCQSGIIIQYFRGGVWNDEIAIPYDYCESSGPIVLSYCDHRYLFNRQIRILQKTASVECGPVNQCISVDGFLADISLTQNTPYPTQFPTKNPTPEPTAFPTPFPVAPTPFPDTQTPFPTFSPVRGGEPTPCPTEPLCETLYEDVGYENADEFHLDMEECCPTRKCPGVVNEERERTVGVDTWYCGHSSGAEGTVADSHTGLECRDDWVLTIQVMFSHEQECCQKCTCYGDPRCYSFNDVFEEYILCDGRTIPDSNSVDDRCIIRKETCLAQRDHEGNSCLWTNPNKTPPNYSDKDKQWYEESKYEVARYGSPCRYNKALSGAASILLYEVPNVYILEVEQGERGYIQSVAVTTNNGQSIVEMGAERCSKGSSWEVTKGSTSHLRFTKKKYGLEYLWTVIDVESGLELNIRCTGNVYNGKLATHFINIESLLEPDEDRIDGASGFCARDVMPEKNLATVEHTEDIRSGGYCDHWNEDSSGVMKREVARIITNNPGVTNVGTEAAYRDFCRKFFSNAWSSVNKCASEFMNAKNVKETISLFCLAATNERYACEENLEILAETAGYHEAFTEAYETYIVNYQLACEVSFSDLPTALEQDADQCMTGVELQWYNPRTDNWVTYAAFPENGACGSYEVKATYSDHKPLFKNPLRLKQKHSFGYCSGCTYTSNVMGWFTFSQEEQDRF